MIYQELTNILMEDGMANEQKRFLNDAYALESLRETGYKNTAYAISELIDNSIDAGAENINLVAQEEVNPNNPRHPYRIAEIGLIDDGNGSHQKHLMIV